MYSLKHTITQFENIFGHNLNNNYLDGTEIQTHKLKVYIGLSHSFLTNQSSLKLELAYTFFNSGNLYFVIFS